MHSATRGHKPGGRGAGTPDPGGTQDRGGHQVSTRAPGLSSFKLADYLMCLNNNTTKARRAIPGEKCLRKQRGQGDCEHIHTQSRRTSGR